MKSRTFTVGAGVECDVDRLISTRALVQASSGAGKSYTIRRLLEQTHGMVQQIVIDPEGEFASLREKYDYVLAASAGGDTAADPRTAKLLAERLLELGVSAILDIYELNPDRRIAFVRQFLEGLVDAPKKLWHPVLVILDEAHVYCPEQGQAESATAVKALCSRGRKRGFSAVLATQRLAKLAKDAAAECNNKLIGRTTLDVDMTRAGDELGMTKAERLILRELEDGEFFAFGPALTRQVTKVKVGGVVTRHPEAGSKLANVVPPPTDKVKALLPQLSDLPAENEAREKTVADLRKEIATLKREVAEARRANPAPKPEMKTVTTEVLTDADRALLTSLDQKFDAIVARHAVKLDIVGIRTAVEEAIDAAQTDQAEQMDEFLALLSGKRLQKIRDRVATVATAAPRHAPTTNSTTSRPTPAATPRPRMAPPSSGEGLTPGKQAILDTLSMLEARGIPSSLDTLCAWLDLHPNGGRFRGNLRELQETGHLIGYELTDLGRSAARLLATGIEAVKTRLTPGQLSAFEAIEASLTPLTVDGVAAALGLHPNGGRFRGNLTRLREMGVVTSGQMRVTDGARA